MNRIKKGLFFILFLGMNTFNSFAHLGGRGRIDSGGLSDLSAILMAIAAIIFGGFFFVVCAHDGFKDKDMNKMGCAGFLAVIIGFALLVGMCSH